MTAIGGLYFITDQGLSVNGILDDVIEAIAGGAAVVQYRRKSGSSRVMYEEALAVGAVCSKTDVPFIVNDRLDIALAAGADGVHIGPNDLPLAAVRRAYDGIIGATCSTVEDGVRHVADGADYLGVSPIYATTTKEDAGPAVGTDLIMDLRDEVDVPLVAIGGITLDRVPGVIGAGAHGVCAISATAGSDVRNRVAAFAAAIERGGR